MFKWYQDAAFCIAYLEDLAPGVDGQGPLQKDTLAACRWFARGWTLQELIAPRHVEFHDAAWKFRGLRSELKATLAEVTGIDEDILHDSGGMHDVPIARRMSWASGRNTTRVEDEAYCLLGLFNVHMALIYGEGRKAFMRLQEEIVKESGDLSLFAWTAPPPSRSPPPTTSADGSRGDRGAQHYRGIFAISPKEFASARTLKQRVRGLSVEKEIGVTNRGLKIEATLMEVPSVSKDVVLPLGVSDRDDWPIWSSEGWMGIFIAKTPDGYVRSNPGHLYTARNERFIHRGPPAIYIRKHIPAAESVKLEQRFANSIHVRWRDVDAQILHGQPAHLWDSVRGLFLNQGRGINAYLLLRFPPLAPGWDKFKVVVACSTMDQPVCTIWTETDRQWPGVLNFIETRNEVADYVAVDYLSSFVGGNSSVLTEWASHAIRDPNTGMGAVVTVTLENIWAEGVPALAMHIGISN
ncbi:hypothetical protein BX600DRAFT_477281 [Xylariales sp. PMI_506]|nr:hypothetical protein BX600DRAFT_477281 [Xylariales sp. PMI_506]